MCSLATREASTHGGERGAAARCGVCTVRVPSDESAFIRSGGASPRGDQCPGSREPTVSGHHISVSDSESDSSLYPPVVCRDGHAEETPYRTWPRRRVGARGGPPAPCAVTPDGVAEPDRSSRPRTHSPRPQSGTTTCNPSHCIGANQEAQLFLQSPSYKKRELLQDERHTSRRW